MRVLVLGGTAEARELAGALHAGGHGVTSSLAGRVADPARPAGEVRTGGFGGVDGLVAWLAAHRIEHVVDATHPFAARMTAHAVAATAALGVPLLVLRRPGWTPQPGDRWHRVAGAVAAAERAAELGERVFLATGRGDLDVLTARTDRRFLLRTVDPLAVPPHVRLVRGRGPFTVAAESALLAEHRIDVVVARDSGGPTSAKLVAARERGLPVVLIDRPPPPDAPTVASVADALARLRTPPAPRPAAPPARG